MERIDLIEQNNQVNEYSLEFPANARSSLSITSLFMIIKSTSYHINATGGWTGLHIRRLCDDGRADGETP